MDNITLEKLEVGIQLAEDMAVLAQSLNLEQYREIELHKMVTRLRGYVLAEEVDNRSKVVTITLTFPVYRSWWQYFKGDKFPSWLKKKFPPQFNYVTKTGKKTITFRKLATYPKANIALPKLGDTIVFRNQITEESGGNH